MTKKAFTLYEVIIVIVITGILAAGTYVFLEQMFKRSLKAEFITDKTLETQAAIDQIAHLLRHRIPSSVIGYDNAGNFDAIDQIAVQRPVLEWIGEAVEIKKMGGYSGFIDLERSDVNHLYSPDWNATVAGTYNVGPGTVAVVFAGSFDQSAVTGSFNNAFGWHGNAANAVYRLNNINVVNTANGTDANITLTDANPKDIYAKYSLVDTAYTVARGADLNQTVFDANCNGVNSADLRDFDTTLFLFYNYWPWMGDTFCADSASGANRRGDATVLLEQAQGFFAEHDGQNIILRLQAGGRMGGDDHNMTITKTKAVF